MQGGIIAMELKNWLNKWNLGSLKINAKFLELELNFTDTDKKAAWEMYVELLTRITTQHLLPEEGDEKTALDSIHSLFSTTREILKKYGSSCVEFTKISVIILNQVVRPFTSKWHKKSLEGAFEKPEECEEFRKELIGLQEKIRNYTKLLSEIAGVEDLTEMEE
jgi:hypothetical protein